MGTPSGSASESAAAALPASPAPLAASTATDLRTSSSAHANGRGWRVAGCGCVMAVLLAGMLLVGGGVFMAMNWRSILIMPLRHAMVQSVEQMQLPAEQKQGVIQEMERVFSSFRAGEITPDRMRRIASEVQDHPVFAIGVVHLFKTTVVQNSGLSEEEKSQARKHLVQLSRGLYEERIAWRDLSSLIEPLADAEQKDPTAGDRDAQIRQVMERVQQQVQVAGIPEEQFQVDMVAETRRLVDRLLAEH